MMASLPDGTPLLAPWETTDFCGCCEVTDPAALLFDESKETAQSLGPVQSVNLLYCMMEVRGGGSGSSTRHCRARGSTRRTCTWCAPGSSTTSAAVGATFGGGRQLVSAS